MGETDNLYRDSAQLRSEVTSLGAAFNLRRNQQLVRGSLLGDVQFLKYGADQIPDDSEVLGSVDGKLELHVVPERFQWDFTYGYGQVRTDPHAPVGPNNRQRTTVTSTGPELVLPFGTRNAFEFGAHVAERHFETSDQLDSRLSSVRFGIRRSVSPVTQFTVSVEESENKFDQQPNSYTFDILSVEYKKQLASGEALASIGRGEVETNGKSEPTTVARLNWRRALGTRSRIEVWGGRELTDAGSLFANGGTGGGYAPLSGLADIARTSDGRLRGVTLSSSPLQRDTAGTRFTLNRPLGDFSVSFASARDRFETDTTFDSDSENVQLSASHRFGQRWRGEASVWQWNQDFTVGDRKSDDRTLRFLIARELARGSRFSVSVERNRRISVLDPFSEDYVRVSFGHNFGR